MKLKHLLITFDLELFMGKNSGSVNQNILLPSLKLLEVLKKHEVSSIFYLDTLYLYRLEQVAKKFPKAKSDLDQIYSLLNELILSKAYIFHHIHPHWLDAIYNPSLNTWDLSNNERFSLSCLSESELESVFFQSKSIIEKVYQGHTPPLFFGYRAGGLYAQPFSLYVKHFRNANIKIDSSVLIGAKSNGENNKSSFDYSDCPKESIYYFDNDMSEKSLNPDFIEIPLNYFNLNGVKKVINGLVFRLNKRLSKWKIYGDGIPTNNQIKSGLKTNKFRTKETYSIELLNKYKAHLYIQELNRTKMLQIISHPKFFSKGNIESFDYFLSKLDLSKINTDIFKLIKEELNE